MAEYRVDPAGGSLVAKIIGCNDLSVVNWARGHTTPRVNYMAGIVKFLGFNPFQNGDTLAQRLVNHRKALGTTQKDFARLVEVDPSTLSRAGSEESGSRPEGFLIVSLLFVPIFSRNCELFAHVHKLVCSRFSGSRLLISLFPFYRRIFQKGYNTARLLSQESTSRPCHFQRFHQTISLIQHRTTIAVR